MLEEDPFESLLPWWRRKRWLVAWAVLALFLLWLLLRPPSPVWLPGQKIGTAPEQMETHRSPWVGPGETQITPLAEYRLEARVLSREDYYDDLSPVDLALGWEGMSEQSVIARLNITQSGRWYHYSWENDPPLPLGDIITQSANTHIIPATAAVADRLDKVRKGDRVRLSGALVAVEKPNGWHWRSSTTRNDVGDGACELFWVEQIEILPPVSP